MDQFRRAHRPRVVARMCCARCHRHHRFVQAHAPHPLTPAPAAAPHIPHPDRAMASQELPPVPFADPHCHYWSPKTHQWLDVVKNDPSHPFHKFAPLARPYFPAEHKADLAGVDLRESVYIQANMHAMGGFSPVEEVGAGCGRWCHSGAAYRSLPPRIARRAHAPRSPSSRAPPGGLLRGYGSGRRRQPQRHRRVGAARQAGRGGGRARRLPALRRLPRRPVYARLPPHPARCVPPPSRARRRPRAHPSLTAPFPASQSCARRTAETT